MTRTITAAEAKPGMTIQFDLSGWDVKGTVATVDVRPHAVWIYTEKVCEMSLDLDSPVTVLSEPQPEEPTEFGARVTVGGEKFLRAQHPISVPVPWLSESDGTWRNWAVILAMGPVTVIPDQGWTVPDTPEVPEQIDEWDTWENVPEGVVVANPEMHYQYRKAHGKIEVINPIGGGVWRETFLPLGDFPGQWTRVSDA